MSRQNKKKKILHHAHHAKNQENLNLNERKKSINVDMEMTQILELSDKYFKARILKILQ